jgi:hypothetical protein
MSEFLDRTPAWVLVMMYLGIQVLRYGPAFFCAIMAWYAMPNFNLMGLWLFAAVNSLPAWSWKSAE